MKVVVTGAAGYVGSQTVLALSDAGHEVLAIDHVSLPKAVSAVCAQQLIQNFASDTALDWVRYHQPQAVIHCAAESTVGPSMTNPSSYYDVNVVGTKRLIDTVRQMPGVKFVFSSSAAVYGEPIMTPCHEVDPCEPINPYGETKLVIERLLASYFRAYGQEYVAFRYFNVAGADSQGRAGPHRDGSHIIERALQSVIQGTMFELYGTNYPTRDGTCVRDYVHVEDVAQAHVMALDASVESGVYNLGSDLGVSNLEVISAVERVTGHTLTVKPCAQRAGDPAQLTASPTRWVTTTKGLWQAQSLDSMIASALAWYQQ
jgi:UDP-glucose-4-epimerase GalE